jgi:DNA-binding transcriptional MerR regulator
MIGWIKIHRKFLDWEWFNKSEAVHLFLYLVLKANHKDAQWQGIDIKKGQFITSFGKISADTGISLQVIRTLLKKFEKTNEINIQTTNKFTIVTICKYECYQQENELPNTQLTNEQQTTNKQLTTNKNDKNNKEIYNTKF